MVFDYEALKAAFRQRAIERGIDPQRGLTDYQARMLELKAAGRWDVEGKGRIRFYSPTAAATATNFAAAAARAQFDAADLTPRGMSVDETTRLSDAYVTRDLAGAQEIYREAKAEWERQQRHNRTLKQLNAHRRALEEARLAAVHGDLTRV